MKNTISILVVVTLVMLGLSVAWAQPHEEILPIDTDDPGYPPGSSYSPDPGYLIEPAPLEPVDGGGLKSITEINLRVNPILIDMDNYSDGQSFTKTIKIYNPNTKKATAYMAFASHQNISENSIKVNNSISLVTISIPAATEKTVVVTGTAPSSSNWEATLQIENSLNNEVATCRFRCIKEVDNAPKNLRTRYNVNMDSLAILWDTMGPGITHYKVYRVRDNGSWEYMGRTEHYETVGGGMMDYVSLSIMNAASRGILYDKYAVVGCNHAQSNPSFIQHTGPIIIGPIW